MSLRGTNKTRISLCSTQRHYSLSSSRDFEKGFSPIQARSEIKKSIQYHLRTYPSWKKRTLAINHSAVKDLLEHVESALSHQFRSLSSKYLYSKVNPSLLRWIHFSKSKNM
ncbi:hypothetical protein FOCC_FOCC005329 [Frankliniella occidentalis]|nr:hypothetical protein FOCC_FOCC005329 [Frankliniella occidentalis]